MTKQVRIENADTSDHKIVVQTWRKSADGDVMVKEEHADYPTAMVTGLVFQEQYLIIMEAEKTQETGTVELTSD